MTSLQEIQDRKFWLTIEELTLLLKENRKEIVHTIKNNHFVKDKDVEIFRLELENLSYKLGNIKALGVDDEK